MSRHCDYTLKYSNDMEPIDEGMPTWSTAGRDLENG